MRRSILLAATMATGSILAGPSSALLAQSSESQEAKPIPSIAEKTNGMEKKDGFVPLFWDAKTGKIFLEISRFDTEFLYYVSLPAGMGRSHTHPPALSAGDLPTG